MQVRFEVGREAIINFGGGLQMVCSFPRQVAIAIRTQTLGREKQCFKMGFKV